MASAQVVERQSQPTVLLRTPITQIIFSKGSYIQQAGNVGSRYPEISAFLFATTANLSQHGTKSIKSLFSTSPPLQKYTPGFLAHYLLIRQ